MPEGVIDSGTDLLAGKSILNRMELDSVALGAY